jgi:diaminohydroxyphosphoribosylaminopyrimidine deaminase/5-amino-6-(5-phosphoribosylamino)uracil reductase
LRAAGVELRTGVLEREAARLNEAYIHAIRYKRPFVHLKLALSLDGKIATRTGDSRWITGEESRARVQELRHQSDAILVGAGTAAADDPLLTDRSNMPRRRPLVRVVLDKNLCLSPASRLARTALEIPTMVFASVNADGQKASALEKRGVEVLRDSSGGYELSSVLGELNRRSIQSVLVEGGSRVAGAFLDSGLIDKASFFVAPVIIGGRDAPSAIGGTGAAKMIDAVNLRDVEITRRGRDLEVTGYFPKGEG